MKAIRLQIDILYHVPDDVAEDCYENDKGFFGDIGVEFSKWELNPNEVRIPIDFDFRHAIGEVVDETEEE